jgi:hypothetical protein
VRTVWKYPLSPDYATRIDGGDPRVVHVGVDPAAATDHDRNCPTAWVELEPDGIGDHLMLVFVGTGHSIPWQDYQHVGSCVTPGGLVWHVYDIDRQVRFTRD